MIHTSVVFFSFQLKFHVNCENLSIQCLFELNVPYKDGCL